MIFISFMGSHQIGLESLLVNKTLLGSRKGHGSTSNCMPFLENLDGEDLDFWKPREKLVFDARFP